MTKQGLDAAGFLLVGLGSLTRAKEKLGKPNQRGYQDAAYWAWHGVICVRKALKELKEEEPGLDKPAQV